MYLDIETVGDVNDIPNLTPIAVTFGRFSGIGANEAPEVLFNSQGVQRWFNYVLLKITSDYFGNVTFPEVLTFNGCKFDYRIIANYLPSEIEAIKRSCLSSVDIHLNICVLHQKMVSLTDLSMFLGSYKPKGQYISTSLNSGEGYRPTIMKYCIEEARTFYDLVYEWQRTKCFVSKKYNKSFHVEELLTVRECIELDTTRRWVEKYDWLIN